MSSSQSHEETRAEYHSAFFNLLRDDIDFPSSDRFLSYVGSRVKGTRNTPCIHFPQ